METSLPTSGRQATLARDNSITVTPLNPISIGSSNPYGFSYFFYSETVIVDRVHPRTIEIRTEIQRHVDSLRKLHGSSSVLGWLLAAFSFCYAPSSPKLFSKALPYQLGIGEHCRCHLKIARGIEIQEIGVRQRSF